MFGRKKKEEQGTTNPFTKKEEHDRRIERFTSCLYCSTPFLNRKGEDAKIVVFDDGGANVECQNCGHIHLFSNWNRQDKLGL